MRSLQKIGCVASCFQGFVFKSAFFAIKMAYLWYG